MLNEYDVVVATRDLSDKVPKGTKGTVLMIFQSPDLAYEVEFINGSRETVGVLTVKIEDVTKVWPLP